MNDALLVIFDLDGTLVDSEALCQQAMLDTLPGLQDTPQAMVSRYRGMRFAEIMCDIGHRTGLQTDPAFESRYRARVAELFIRDLKPMPGVADMLQRLDRPCCIASSGPRPKIEQALHITGLARHFEGRTYSAYEVGHWKPHPGLFLHAARDMGYAGSHCIVVEDSLVGLAAAQAANMQALHYTPDRQDGPTETPAFSDMRDLPDLLKTLAGKIAT